jgi:hypothetical protein
MAKPTRKVWKDSRRPMLTLLDGELVQLEAGELEPVQAVVRPKVLVWLPKSVYRYSPLAFQPAQSSVSQPAPTVLPTRVSFQVTAVAAVAVGNRGDEDEPAQEENEDEGEAQENRAPEYANEPLISANATPPVTYSRLQGVTSQPTRARIEESDFCLTEPANESVRKKLDVDVDVDVDVIGGKLGLELGMLVVVLVLVVTAIDVDELWFNELSLFFQDQSPSRPTTQFPNCTR